MNKPNVKENRISVSKQSKRNIIENYCHHKFHLRIIKLTLMCINYFNGLFCYLS